MITRAQLRRLGKTPAIYCLYGGRRSADPAYVGIADNLQTRIAQHLIRRDSSVTTGVATVTLNPDLVTEIRWWRHSSFGDRVHLEAAELIAFRVLDPVLRSRGAISAEAEALAQQEGFRDEMTALFHGVPEGDLRLESLETIVDRLEDLEQRIRRLEQSPTGLSPSA